MLTAPLAVVVGGGGWWWVVLVDSVGRLCWWWRPSNQSKSVRGLGFDVALGSNVCFDDLCASNKDNT